MSVYELDVDFSSHSEGIRFTSVRKPAESTGAADGDELLASRMKQRTKSCLT